MGTTVPLPLLFVAFILPPCRRLWAAVGGIIEGNCFDVLFVAFSEAAYRSGSIYRALGDRQTFMIALTIPLPKILLLGLIRRENTASSISAWKVFLIVVFYVAMFAFLQMSHPFQDRRFERKPLRPN